MLGDEIVPLKDLYGSFGDLVVGSLLVVRIANLKLLGERAHSFDPPRHLLSRNFFHVAPDMAGQGHDTIIDRNTNIGSINPRIELKLVHDSLPQSFVVHT